MELIIYSPQENQFVKEITFNFEDIKQEMTTRLVRYQDLVYNEDNIREAKADRANLNKFKEALETKRKEVKKQCLAPYEEFERKIKELTAMIDAPILAIDEQVKSYEQAQKEEKRAVILDYYNEHIGDLAALLPINKIFDEKWLNATARLAGICEIIDTIIDKTTSDLKTIADLGSEFELQIKDTYLRTLDLSAALNEKTRLEQQKAKMEEYQRQQEERKAAEEAEKEPEVHIIDGKHGFEGLKPGDRVAFAHGDEPERSPLIKMDFRVWATADQLSGLKTFLKENNIKYGRVE